MDALYLITGSSSGIGASIARQLSSSGSHVILTGRSEDRLKRLSAELKGSVSIPCDLQKASEIDSLCDFVEQQSHKHGKPLKGLVNNAGIFIRQSALETSDRDWRELFESNLFSAVHLTNRLFPLLKKSRPSSVLNISSSLAMRTVANTSAYSASKAAMVSWSNSLALEWSEFDIRVNCICPGLVDTPIHTFHGQPESSEARIMAHAAQPLRRLGTPLDVANAAEFLLSEKSSWTTGTVLTVDGGVHLK
jgi:NAD(P)-dependent dehydrogenase (short-subunit alcohol dehydrogenase family)